MSITGQNYVKDAGYRAAIQAFMKQRDNAEVSTLDGRTWTVNSKEIDSGKKFNVIVSKIFQIVHCILNKISKSYHNKFETAEKQAATLWSHAQPLSHFAQANLTYIENKMTEMEARLNGFAVASAKIAQYDLDIATIDARLEPAKTEKGKIVQAAMKKNNDFVEAKIALESKLKEIEKRIAFKDRGREETIEGFLKKFPHLAGCAIDAKKSYEDALNALIQKNTSATEEYKAFLKNNLDPKNSEILELTERRAEINAKLIVELEKYDLDVSEFNAAFAKFQSEYENIKVSILRSKIRIFGEDTVKADEKFVRANELMVRMDQLSQRAVALNAKIDEQSSEEEHSIGNLFDDASVVAEDELDAVIADLPAEVEVKKN